MPLGRGGEPAWGDAGVEQDWAQQVAQCAPRELAVVEAPAVAVARARIGKGAVAPPAPEPREENIGVEVEAGAQLLPGQQASATSVGIGRSRRLSPLPCTRSHGVMPSERLGRIAETVSRRASSERKPISPRTSRSARSRAAASGEVRPSGPWASRARAWALTRFQVAASRASRLRLALAPRFPRP